MKYERTLRFALSLVTLFAVERLDAGLITVNFTAGLTFNATAVVTGGGATAGNVIGQIFGPGSSGAGTAQVTAGLTYQSSTPVFQQAPVGRGSAAIYAGPVTAAQVAIGSSTVTANVPLINSSPSSGAFASGLSATTACFGASTFVARFCPPGLTTNPTNGSFVTDNIDVITTLPNGTTVTKSADSLALYIGGTAGSPEFSPTLSAGAAGPVHVKSLYIGIIGKPGENLFDSSALPQSLVLTDLSRIDSTLVQVLIDGPGLASPILLRGSATGLNVGPAAVPEPGTLCLLGAGLGLLVWRARRRGLAESLREI